MNTTFPVLDGAAVAARLAAPPAPYQQHYFAMFSSVLGGIVTDPRLMLVPADDHLVHRGDGVFDTAKCLAGSLYNLEAHLDRLEHSGACVFLPLPLDRAGLRDAVLATVRAGGRRDCGHLHRGGDLRRSLHQTTCRAARDRRPPVGGARFTHHMARRATV